MRIAVVAPSCSLKREAAERVQQIVAARGDCELVIHPQCFLSEGHFAGPDAARLAALREVMADPSVDAVWFARGGFRFEPDWGEGGGGPSPPPPRGGPHRG